MNPVQSKMHGLGVALVTPFNKQGMVDFPALQRLVEHQHNHGTGFLVVLGTTGETPTLSRDEQRRVVDFVLEKDPLFARINLEPDEFALYQKVFEKMRIDAPPPDLVIYLQASPDRLLERIERRGIPAEKLIDRDYLEQLNEVYSEFFLYYDAAPLLIVNANEIDLAQGDQDYELLVDYMLNIKKGRHYFNPNFFS